MEAMKQKEQSMAKPMTHRIAIGLMAVAFILGFQVSASAGGAGRMKAHRVSFIGGGIQLLELSGLNDRLNASGISDFDEFAPTVTLGHYNAARRLMFGGNIAGTFWRRNYDANRRTTLGAGRILFTAAFNVLQNGLPVRLYPEGGIGAGAFKLKSTVHKRSFEDVLSSNTVESTMWQATFLLSAGAGVDFTLPSMMDRKRPGAIVGLRAGYLFDPAKNEKWYEPGAAKIENGPAPRMKGFYASITLGGMRHARQGKGKNCGKNE
jgi:hypothetical protein